MATTFRGASGRLRAGPRVAADLGEWSVAVGEEMGGGVFRCDAAIRRRDEFWLEHGRGFVLDLDIGANVWRWRAVEIAAGQRLSAKATGNPEVI